MNAVTMTGYPAELIPQLIDAIYPADAYEPIPYGNTAGKTDLGQEWVRGRLDMVFGAHGYGWRLVPYGSIGGTFTSEEMRAGKARQGEAPKETKWYVVRLESWVLEYCLEIDGKREWITTSAISGSDDNTELPYAYRGAFTNLMKHAVRAMGGIAHIYAGYGHEQAERGDHPDAWYPGTPPKIGKVLPAPALDPQKEAIKAWYRQAQKDFPNLNSNQFLEALQVDSLTEFGDFTNDTVRADATATIEMWLRSPEPDDPQDEPQFTPAGEPPDMGVPPELADAPGLVAKQDDKAAEKRAAAFTSFWKQAIVKDRKTAITTSDMIKLFGAGYREDIDWNSTSEINRVLAKVDELISERRKAKQHPASKFAATHVEGHDLIEPMIGDRQ